MAKRAAKKIKGRFCERTLVAKTKFAKGSFRWKKSGKSWLLIGCPKGAWQPRAQHCQVGTRAHKLLTATAGTHCAARARYIRK